MSWADDIRCLFCDGRLPLYRKITNGQFCSSSHRKAYWQEQERLAVERLHQTHDSLRAYRPLGQGTVEAILGNAALPDPVEIAAEIPVPKPDQRPWWLPQVNAGQVPMGRLLPNPIPAQPRWLSNDRVAGDLKPCPPPNSLRPPVNVHKAADCGFAQAGAVELEKIWIRSASAWPVTEPLLLDAPEDGLQYPLSYPAIRLMVELATQDDELLAQSAPSEMEDSSVAEAVPHIAGILAIPLPEILDWRMVLEMVAEPVTMDLRSRLPIRAPEIPAEEISSAGRLPVPLPDVSAGQMLTASSTPVEITGQAALPVRAAAFTKPDLRGTGMVSLTLSQMGAAPAKAQDLTGAGEFRPAAGAPSINLATPPMRPRLRHSPGCRYTVGQREPGNLIAIAEGEDISVPRPVVALPERGLKVLRTATGQKSRKSSATVSPDATPVPNPTGPLSLSGLNKPTALAVEMRPAPDAMTLPQPPTTEPMRPHFHLEPLDAKPIADVFSAPVFPAPEPTPGVDATGAPTTPEEAAAKVHFWTHGIDFWNHAPRDLKILVFAIPVLIALALHPPLPKVHVAAAGGTQAAESTFQRTLNEHWGTVRQSVLDRAAVALDEDFRSGLDEWVSRGDAPTEWSFDATGFVRPGPLALYRPSLGLVDYQLQFLGLIDKKALSWVVRAADFENYYVIKLVVLKPGPLPQLGLVRYAVVNGKADARADTVVPIDARSDMLYRVNLEVHGEDFALYVQGQLVDSWSEPRLPRGGVGFFSARGEDSRLRWVQVTHQYDMLGKLCAYLAPYNIPSTSGSWQP